MKRLAYIVAAAMMAAGATGCAKSMTNKTASADAIEEPSKGIGNVEYTEARNYFVNNNAPKNSTVKIMSSDEFDKYFGMAAVMGKDGQPTAIDFSKQFVIAYILPETDLHTEISPANVIDNDEGLTIYYRLTIGEKQSYTIKPFFAIIMDIQYKDKAVTFKRSK